MNSPENPNLNKKGLEKFPPAEQAEQFLGSIKETTEQSIKAASDTAKTIEASSFSAEHKEKLRDKLKRSIKKMFRIFSFAAALTGAAGMADYTLTRYKVEQKTGANGGVVYIHQDQETTHIINILSGKEQLSNFDKKDILLDYLTDELKSFHEDGQYEAISQSGLEKMSFSELEEIAREFMHVRGFVRHLFTDSNPGIETFDQELYNALWKLEKECGNPKVRFRLGSKKSILNLHDPDRSFYQSFTNTIFIDMGENETAIEYYISELSHGKQFDQNPVSSYVMGVKDVLKTIKGALVNRENLDSSYGNLYDQSGTLEYQAHKELQPKLETELESLTPIRTAQKGEEHRKQEENNEKFKAAIERLSEEKHTLLNKSEDIYFDKLYKTKNQIERDKLNQELRDRASKIEEEYLNRRNTIFESYKKF